ncbi:MAG: ArsC/Spx/MgsR family protein [Flavobacteriaceae bacterium]|nr:ArsC/Spx/MgsR family protein [Flavobacteriaceae bacterium]MDZ4147016.1 ArsC/Spx/MgsR family protein [Flavobacteriaceae bacterium]
MKFYIHKSKEFKPKTIFFAKNLIGMKMIYHLKTCTSCKRFLDKLQLPSDVVLQNVKSQPITAAELDQLKALSGSYESLFSRKSKLYTEMGLKQLELTEDDYRHYILDHYTFLKRPICVIDQQIFMGPSEENLLAVRQLISSNG